MIGELWSQFIQYRKTGDPKLKIKPWREKTLHEYKSYWERSFKYFWAHREPDKFEGDWTEFIEAERRRSKKGDKLEFIHAIKYLSTFCNWLLKTGKIQKKIILYDPNWIADESAEEKRKIIFTDEQVEQMIWHSSGTFGLFIKMGLLMGMRSSEMTQLQKDRINMDENVIRLRAIDCKTGSKTGKGRAISIHNDVLLSLRDQLINSGDSLFLFPNRNDKNRAMHRSGFKNNWKELLEKCEIKAGTIHSMRATCATKLFSNKDLNPALICKSLGFSMQIAMKTYINFSNDDLALVASKHSYDKNDE